MKLDYNRMGKHIQLVDNRNSDLKIETLLMKDLDDYDRTYK